MAHEQNACHVPFKSRVNTHEQNVCHTPLISDHSQEIMLYKIINNIVDVDLNGNLLMSVSSYHTRCHLTQPYSRVDAYKYSFVLSAIK